MQSGAVYNHTLPVLSMQHRRAAQAVRRARIEAAWDDRVTENIFDVEDERAEVAIIARGIDSDAY
jgi:hypothetical protein